MPRAISLLTLSVLVVVWAPAFADTLTGKVVKVTDGDTITVLDSHNTQYRIRLQGIDAPERKQAFGKASRKHLARLVAGKTVTVRWAKRDRYGRIVGKVLYTFVWHTSVDNVDVCLEQVRAGYAWHYKHYQEEQTPADRYAYAKAEWQARQKRLGLWQDKLPMPPWE
jgi:endonuclease YncB( thermonuclease family)